MPFMEPQMNVIVSPDIPALTFRTRAEGKSNVASSSISLAWRTCSRMCCSFVDMALPACAA
ncbi:hypothetical protein BREVUG8_110456 [Brevundimonas sp. G8]|nr:hypothetical protein BREVUG8_110456 [Brevundimonas sp. G8]